MKKKLLGMCLCFFVCFAACGKDAKDKTASTENSVTLTETSDALTPEASSADTVGNEGEDISSEATDGTASEVVPELIGISGEADGTFTIVSIGDGENGTVVKLDYEGEEKEIILEFDSELKDNAGIYEIQIADVDQDGKDDVLIQRYYINNISEDIHEARLYHVTNGTLELWSDLDTDFLQNMYLTESSIEASMVTLVGTTYEKIDDILYPTAKEYVLSVQNGNLVKSTESDAAVDM